jgi:hypothetical protein
MQALFALLWACTSDTGLTEQHPEITVAPDSLAFGDTPVLSGTDLPLFVSNGGRVDLTVDLAVDLPFSLDVSHVVVEPGDTATVTVGFHPTTYLDYTGSIAVTSDDEDNPSLAVPLTGTGVPEPTPDVDVAPLSLDFGPLLPPGQGVLHFTIGNVGDAPLELGVLGHTGSGAFVLYSDPSDQTVMPGDELPVVVGYVPANADGDGATLAIPTNDPDEPLVQVALIGNGGGDGSYPIAVADCPTEVDPPENVAVADGGSSDPGGHLPLTYAWRLAGKPTGSQAELVEEALADTEFFADLAGDYDVELVVTNSLGVRSPPARCRIAAIPTEDLHVELIWDGLRSDVDLHLRQASGSLFERPQDCNWCNTHPTWGATLDLDDRSGLGPENINVADPADGNYDVAVHVFDDDGDGSIIATVRVWTFGVLEDERSHRLERNEVWEVGRVNWPDGTFGVVDSIATAEARTCF